MLSSLLVVSGFHALVIAHDNASAWSNGGYSADPSNPDYGTHDWIAEGALGMQVREADFLSTYRTEILLGTEYPDNPDYIGDYYDHHVYYDSSGAPEDDVSASRASQKYSEALSGIAVGNLAEAARSIGAMTHYISDVGVFAHTMGSATDWGTEEHHSDYEQSMDARSAYLVFPYTSLQLGNKTAYDATLDLARKTTFGQGSIKANVWMDDNYDWESTEFVASADASLYESVLAVAAAVNHLLEEAGFGTPAPEPGEPAPNEDEGSGQDDSPTSPSGPDSNGLGVGILAVLAAGIVAAVAGTVLVLFRKTKGSQ